MHLYDFLDINLKDIKLYIDSNFIRLHLPFTGQTQGAYNFAFLHFFISQHFIHLLHFCARYIIRIQIFDVCSIFHIQIFY